MCKNRERRRQGFTLIEMVVVVAIIAMMAGLILPNLVAFQQSRNLHDAQAALLRLPAEAKNEAVKSKTTTTLRVEGSDIVLERKNVETGDPEEVKRVPVGAGMQVESAQKGSDSTDVASWTWQAFPDGTTDSGALTFRIGSAEQYLYLPAQGAARWGTDALPQPSDETWAAGDLEQRTTAVATPAATGAPRGQ
jgi:prepilin-type N-terminal cleavage/methylation domain-containing protein